MTNPFQTDSRSQRPDFLEIALEMCDGYIHKVEADKVLERLYECLEAIEELGLTRRQYLIDANNQLAASRSQNRVLRELCGAAAKELQSYQSYMDGHPVISHNLIYNLQQAALDERRKGGE